MTNELGILNVGAGDTKLSFDKSNPAECIRAARIVKDMLRRGYALLIEVDRDGVKAFERVRDFREDTFEYIIADFDPVTADAADKEEAASGQVEQTETPADTSAGEGDTKRAPRGRRSSLRAVPASGTRGIAVARTAGG